MESFEFYFLFNSCDRGIAESGSFEHIELQKCDLSFSESHEKIRMVTKHIEKMRSSGFDKMWTILAVEGTNALDLLEPEIPRARKREFFLIIQILDIKKFSINIKIILKI